MSDNKIELNAIKRNLKQIEQSMRTISRIYNDMAVAISFSILDINQSIDRMKGKGNE